MNTAQELWIRPTAESPYCVQDVIWQLNPWLSIKDCRGVAEIAHLYKRFARARVYSKGINVPIYCTPKLSTDHFLSMD